MTLFEWSAAAAARDAALDRLEEARAGWINEARIVAERLARDRGAVTIDDVREACPPPDGVDPRVMGAVMRPPVFEACGFVLSSRAECHRRPIRVFKLRGTT